MNEKWIPCEDYLPECHRNVLVTLDNGALFIGYVVLKDMEYQWRTITDEIKINVKLDKAEEEIENGKGKTFTHPSEMNAWLNSL